MVWQGVQPDPAWCLPAGLGELAQLCVKHCTPGIQLRGFGLAGLCVGRALCPLRRWSLWPWALPFPSICDAMSLKKLAQSLGLSPTTVSRALNGYPEVNARTRQLVLEAAGRYGYHANPTARRLALGRTDTIGWVYPLDSPLISDASFLQTIAGVTERLAQEGIDFHLIAARPGAELGTYERLVQGRLVDGLVVAHTRVEDARIDYLHGQGFPFVAYGRTQAPSASHSWFDLDNACGAQLAVDHLVALGVREIAYLYDDLALNFSFQRLQGFRHAMAQHGLELPEAWVRATGDARRSGYDAARALLQLAPRLQALIVDNRLAGIGALHAAADCRLSVGQDLQVVIFGGVPPDTIVASPAVIAVELSSAARIGAQLAELVMHAVHTPTAPARQTLWRPRIVAPTTP